MDKKEIKERLKTSVEVESLNANTLLVTFVTLIFCLFAYFRYIHTRLGPLPFCFTGAAMLTPMCLYHGWVLWKIFRKAESYRFYRVKLTQLKGGSWRNTMRFQILLKTEERTILTETRSIFLTHGFGGPLIQDYVNCDVTIAYNHETEQVVVIG